MADHWAKLTILWALCLCAIALLGAYVSNLVLPSDWRWLSPADMSSIKDIVVSIIAGLVMSFSVKYLAR